MQTHLANVCEENSIRVKEVTDNIELTTMTLPCEEYNTCMFIHIDNNRRYRALKSTLDNYHLLKKDAYPKTLEMALKLIMNFQNPGNGPRHTMNDQ